MKNIPTLQTRRQFLRTSILGAAATWTVPVFLERTFLALNAAAADSAVQAVTGKDGRILVVIQLAGGNDGLNTIVPYGDDAYYKARQRLGIPAKDVRQVNYYLGFAPALAPFSELYDAGDLAVVQGVGYPNPNRSHFRSTEIWTTASDADRNESTGWIGRYFDACCQGADPSVGVSLTQETPQTFFAENPTGVIFSNPEQYRYRPREKAQGSMSAAEFFYRQLNQPEELMTEDASGSSIGAVSGAKNNGIDNLDYLRRAALDAQVSSDQVQDLLKNSANEAAYPNHRLATQLSLISRMIAGGFSTRVYYASIGGFDTHTNQRGTHERLLTELSESLKAFTDDLRKQGNLERTLVMTFSEFGRRVADNASGGTDHGAAAPLFLAGGPVKAGFHGRHPNLTDLERGDLKFGIDFRSIYATVLEKWLQAPSAEILGRQFPLLNFI